MTGSSKFDFSVPRAPIYFESIDRLSVRAFVQNERAYRTAAVAAGLNSHQIDLDQADALKVYFEALSSDDLKNFVSLWTEESAAANAGQIDDALKNRDQISAESLAVEAKSNAAVSRGVFVLAIVIGLIIFVIMRR